MQITSTDEPERLVRDGVSLVVPTRNRLAYLRPRIPIWTEAGFDEVLVVNTPTDRETADLIAALCREYGVRYVETPPTFRDMRARARNMGAIAATSTWIFFSDDDVDAISGVDHATFERCATGFDWLAGEKGDIVVFHRRAAFLAFGGYPEDMVASEDTIMSNRARAAGRGGPLDSRWARSVPIQDTPREEPLNRARAHFWYSLTLPLFFIRAPRFEAAVRSDSYRFLGLLKRILLGDAKSIVYASMYAAGRLASPAHLIAVLLRAGRRGFLREALAGWGEARSRSGL